MDFGVTMDEVVDQVQLRIKLHKKWKKGGQDALEMRSTWWHPSSLNRASWCSLMMNRTKLRSDTENETFFGFWSTRHSQNELGLFLFIL